MATPQTAKTPENASKPANGDTKAKAPATTAGPANAPEAGKAEEPKEDGKEEKRAGVIPQMPIAAAWREGANGAFVVALLHPRGGELKVRGKGLGGTTGSLADEGYPIGAWRSDAPKWVETQKRIPEGVTVIGFANILGFPLPTSEG